MVPSHNKWKAWSNRKIFFLPSQGTLTTAHRSMCRGHVWFGLELPVQKISTLSTAVVCELLSRETVCENICADYFMIRLQNFTYTTVNKRLYKLDDYCTRTRAWLSGGLRQTGAIATNVEWWGISVLHVVTASLLDGSSVLQFGAKFIVAIDWLDSKLRINQLLGLTHWQSES